MPKNLTEIQGILINELITIVIGSVSCYDGNNQFDSVFRAEHFPKPSPSHNLCDKETTRDYLIQLFEYSANKLKEGKPK